MSPEARRQEQYSAAEFISNLESGFGGPLYFGTEPQFDRKLIDITRNSDRGLAAVANWTISKAPGIRPPKPTGDLAGDFQAVITHSSPHPAEAGTNIHMLADPFCRAYMSEGLEMLMEESGRINPKNDVFVTKDNLPFDFENLYDFILEVPRKFASLGEYFDFASSRAETLSLLLTRLSDEQKNAFREQYQRSMERSKIYASLLDLGKSDDLHPMIQIMVGYVSAAYLLRK